MESALVHSRAVKKAKHNPRGYTTTR